MKEQAIIGLGLMFLRIASLFSVGLMVAGCVDQNPAPIEYGNRKQVISSRPLNNAVHDDATIMSSPVDAVTEDRADSALVVPQSASNADGDLISVPTEDNSKIIYHTVEEEETLASIASNYNKIPEEIASFNGLPYPCILDEAQIIKIKVTGDVLNKKNREEGTKSAHGGDSFIKPVTSGTIITKFGDNLHPGVSKGINIAAEKGAEVRSVAAGTIMYAGHNNQFGNLLIIKINNSDNYVAYGHLQDLIVTKNHAVVKGEVIGHVGQSGDIPQIHFAIREGKNAVDPLKYITFD